MTTSNQKSILCANDLIEHKMRKGFFGYRINSVDEMMGDCLYALTEKDERIRQLELQLTACQDALSDLCTRIETFDQMILQLELDDEISNVE